MKLHQIILTLSFLIIALSVGYYLVIFIPQKEQFKLEQQKVELETKEKLRLKNKAELDNCLNDVSERYNKALEDPKVSNLSLEEGKVLFNEFNNQRESCFKRYPQ